MPSVAPRSALDVLTKARLLELAEVDIAAARPYGSNFTDYIREAHRCIRLDATLHIWEPASYFDDVGASCAGLARLAGC